MIAALFASGVQSCLCETQALRCHEAAAKHPRAPDEMKRLEGRLNAAGAAEQ